MSFNQNSNYPDSLREGLGEPVNASDIAIRVTNLSKCYQIYRTPRERLKQFIFPRMQRLAGQTPKQYFREFWALKDVSFEIKKGETVGIIGRNGSGKSTLLQLICGTLTPTSGSVETTGRIAALLELGSGFNPEFTGRENVYMNAVLLGISTQEVDERFDEITAFADIGQFIEQPIKNYSSGMAVRLAFAVQAVINPDIFIVDEALAVGDEKFQRKCFARLEELKSRGSAILFVSHSPASIIELCDKTLFLDHGQRLMYCEAPKAIRAYQKLIYAPVEEQQRLIHEWRKSEQTGEVLENIDPAKPEMDFSESPSEYFDRGLVPETTVVYPIQGAEIEAIKILDAEGHWVNVLQPRRSYQFVMTGHFGADFSGVFFAIHIRSVSGVVITGQRYPEEGKFAEHIVAGKAFKISFAFEMDLLPGVYFVGGGIWANQEPNCPHRILDALMFRVVSNTSPNSFGYVDISTHEPLFEMI